MHAAAIRFIDSPPSAVIQKMYQANIKTASRNNWIYAVLLLAVMVSISNYFNFCKGDFSEIIVCFDTFSRKANQGKPIDHVKTLP